MLMPCAVLPLKLGIIRASGSGGCEEVEVASDVVYGIWLMVTGSQRKGGPIRMGHESFPPFACAKT